MEPVCKYVDLDHTLISTRLAQPGDVVPENCVVMRFAGEIYHSALRPCAHQLLARCRETGPTRMLTTATRAYSLAHNEQFQLGFAPEEIFAREDWRYNIPGAYGGHETLLLAENVCPNSLLIDDFGPTSEGGRMKRKFLGIPEERYIQIRSYEGRPEPERFKDELASILERISAMPSIPVELIAPPIVHKTSFNTMGGISF